MKHDSKTRADPRKHTEDHPLIAPSLNHTPMIITVLTKTITHTVDHNSTVYSPDGTKIINEADYSSDCINSYETTITISMCSINISGLNSKLKYNILQSYIQTFDIVSLTETKCDNI